MTISYGSGKVGSVQKVLEQTLGGEVLSQGEGEVLSMSPSAGMSQAAMARMQQEMALNQAKGERETLKKRILVTQKSVETLEQSLIVLSPVPPPNPHLDQMLRAMIEAQLIQLKANLQEGLDRVIYLDGVIKSAESPLAKAHLIPSR